MGKYLVKSSRHDNQEIVVIIPDIVDLMARAQANRRGFELEKFLIEGLDNMERVLLKDIFSSKLNSLPLSLVFSQKEAMERIKLENDKLQFGLISLDEFLERKAYWAKYIK